MRALFNGTKARLQSHVGPNGHLIRTADAGETLENAFSRFLVHAFDISLLANIEGCGRVTLKEGQLCLLVDLTRQHTIPLKG